MTSPYRGPHRYAELSLKVVLAAVDNTSRAGTVLRAAATLAEKFGAKLHVVRAVVLPPEFPAAAHNVTVDRLPAFLVGQARGELDALVASVEGAELALPLVVIGNPWRAILDAAEQIQADMIVLGTHKHRRLEHLLGTAAGKIASHAHTHVLVVNTDPPEG